MYPHEDNQPKTPPKNKSLFAPFEQMHLIVSAEKPDCFDFMQEILLDPSQQDIPFFSQQKDDSSPQQSSLKSYDSMSILENSSPQESIEEEKYLTVKKSTYENLIINQGKHLSTTQTNKKGCNCDKSKCLKNYCVCYKTGNTCSPDCQCIDCANTQITSQHIKNQKIALELISNTKQKGCNCKNSNCLKNYCLCHQFGKKCSEICKCQNCHNTEDKQTKDEDDKDQKMQLNFESGRKKIKISEFNYNDGDNKENISIYNNSMY